MLVLSVLVSFISLDGVMAAVSAVAPPVSLNIGDSGSSYISFKGQEIQSIAASSENCKLETPNASSTFFPLAHKTSATIVKKYENVWEISPSTTGPVTWYIFHGTPDASAAKGYYGESIIVKARQDLTDTAPVEAYVGKLFTVGDSVWNNNKIFQFVPNPTCIKGIYVNLGQYKSFLQHQKEKNDQNVPDLFTGIQNSSGESSGDGCGKPSWGSIFGFGSVSIIQWIPCFIAEISYQAFYGIMGLADSNWELPDKIAPSPAPAPQPAPTPLPQPPNAGDLPPDGGPRLPSV